MYQLLNLECIETAKQVNEMTSQLDEKSTKICLYMDAGKTKFMTNSLQIPIKNIEYVDHYVYLGKQISFKNNYSEEEVGRRSNILLYSYFTLRRKA